MKTSLFKSCVAAFVLCSAIACKRDKPETPVLPASDNRSETSTLTNTERLHAEFIAFNNRVINQNVDIDQLKTDYENGNATAVNLALGYTETEAALKLTELKNLSAALNAEYGVTPTTYPLSPEVFSAMKQMQAEKLADIVFAAPKEGGNNPRPTKCKEPQFSACLTVAFAAGLESAGLLGIAGLYLCYCDQCSGSNVDKICGKGTAPGGGGGN